MRTKLVNSRIVVCGASGRAAAALTVQLDDTSMLVDDAENAANERTNSLIRF